MTDDEFRQMAQSTRQEESGGLRLVGLLLGAVATVLICGASLAAMWLWG
jgi:hypothetical protein